MEKGTIVLTKFPFTDLTSNKRRPALVLVNPIPNKPDVIVAFISSVIPTQIEASDFVLMQTDKDFDATGLTKNSVFKMDKLATLDVSIFTGEMGKVSEELFNKLIQKLKITLDLKN